MEHSLARLDAQRGIEAGERLVEQHDPGMWSERAGERNAPLLAAGELMRRARGVALVESDELERLGDAGSLLAL